MAKILLYFVTPCCKRLSGKQSGEKSNSCPLGEDMSAWILDAPLLCLALQKKHAELPKVHQLSVRESNYSN